MSDERDQEQRALKLLIQALKTAGIEERDQPRLLLFGRGDAFYHVRNNSVEVEIYSTRMFIGDLHCTFRLRLLTERTCYLFPDDDEALETMVVMLNYLRARLDGLLDKTSHNVFARSQNIGLNRLSAPDRKRLREMREQLESELLALPAVQDREKPIDWEKEFRAEKQGRGGSSAKLSATQRESLHKRYDAIREGAKPIRQTYRANLKTFEQSRQRKGYKWEEWQDVWAKLASELYEFDADFLNLFASKDNPSASEIAYRWLAVETGHTVGYLKNLISALRKEPQSKFE
ncbi:MAG TPA: hypothetical protein VLB46_09360 [Pyrinomonadaceae bacterium]|nr:hypothetical protein [Pyrinomonadaceae bacterium]